MSNTLGIVLTLLLFTALLVNATRTSLSHARQPYLIELREIRPRVVEQTFKLLEAPQLSEALHLIETILDFLLAGGICLVMMGTPASSIPWWFVLPGMLIFAVVLFILQVLLEAVVLRAPERWALRLTWVARLFYGLATPFIWLSEKLRPVRVEGEAPLGSVTDDELKSWMEEGQTKGSLEMGERKMIYSIFHLSDTLCREIMVPRIDVLALEANTVLPEAIQKITSQGHSRVPVYEESIDNITGILYAKDLLKIKLDSAEPASIRLLLRPAYFVPEAKKVDELLREMQEKRVHLAVVVDEYGGMAGLVTLEDIVEEIVGEIRDEYDASEEKQYEQVGDNEYVFSGRIDVEDVNEILNTHLTREVADTLGGFIYGEIGRVPVEGEQVEVEGWTLSVEQVLGRRIRRVRVRRTPALPVEEENNTDESGK